jgi:putative DNA primase/helicase
MTGHSGRVADSGMEGSQNNSQVTRKARRRSHGFGLEEVEAWPEPVDGSALLEELRQVLRRYVVLPPMASETLALWVVHTYAFELRNVSTYIGLGSPEKRCGKTTLLSVLSELANRPVVASNISPPALFRVIEEARPTLLIDEADTFLQANDEMRGILNSGYTRKTAYVVRVANETRNTECGMRNGKEPPEGGTPNEGNGNQSRLARFSCWCPKVIAAIGRLPETLLDRCIAITMQRKMADETCERLRSLDGEVLRRKCARFAADHAEAIATAKPDIPAQLNDRAGDIWEPLLTVADLAGGEWPKLAREAALQLNAGMPDSTIIGSLLMDILAEFAERKAERIFSRDLVETLNQLRERPWAEVRKGKQVDGLWLAKQLRPFGVRPKAMWIGKLAGKGYEKSDFREVWQRYLTRSDYDQMVADRGTPNEDDEGART